MTNLFTVNILMNVLILTPDAVGSTLLQRLITIYMQFHDFNRPVINLHELTNGLERYYSPDFNCEIVSKSRVKNWGYYQTLEQVVELLSSVDHYKTSRLAHYHLRNRRDSVADQISFCRYLDENFFVIACRRANVFEHAVSMSLNRIHKTLNVYSHKDKIDAFANLYLNPINLDTQVLLGQLDTYKDYLSWSQSYFNVASYFHYDTDMPNIERYILALPIFSHVRHRISWQEKFDIDFNDWNRCHHLPSDIGTIAIANDNSKLQTALSGQSFTHDFVHEYQQHAPAEWPAIQSRDDFQALPMEIKTKFFAMRHLPAITVLPQEYKIYYEHFQERYQRANSAIDRMQELDIIVTPPPIKKHTLAEKKHVIKNWQKCVDIYNEWVSINPGIAQPITDQMLQDQMIEEKEYWHGKIKSKISELEQPHTAKLEYQNDTRHELHQDRE